MDSEYGPEVECDFTDSIEAIHRPAGSNGPWFCMACGSTAHAEIHPSEFVSATEQTRRTYEPANGGF